MINSSIRLSLAGFEVGWIDENVLAADVVVDLNEDLGVVESLNAAHWRGTTFDPR